MSDDPTSAASIQIVLDDAVRTAVAELARREHATPEGVLFAAFDVVLARYSLESNIVGEPSFREVLHHSRTPVGEPLPVQLVIDATGSPALVGAAGRFDRAMTERMAGHVANVLRAAISDPDARVSRLPLLGDAEYRQIISEWNDTARPYARERRMHDLFSEQAARSPDATALIAGATAWTYRELEARTNRLARQLQQLGASRGAHVGVWLDRSPHLVEALVSTVKAGAAYVPIELDWPAERVVIVLANLGVTCLLTDRARLRALHDIRWRLPALEHVICLDVDTPDVPVETTDAASVRSMWDHVAHQSSRIEQGGFSSSYTGERFSEAEVDQYREHVRALVLPHLGTQRRVLEIGAGNGELMAALAPDVASYVGLDPSEAMLALARARIPSGSTSFELVQGFAHELDRFASGSFDVVLIASTVQFFAGPVYLQRVIEAAARVLRAGGAIVLADVLDSEQKDAFVASVAEYRASHPGAAARTRFDDVLYIDRAYLQRIAPATVTWTRRSGFTNELRFRSDAVLTGFHDGAPGSSPAITSARVAALDAAPVTSTATADDLAYVIHTSGSTGAPKGVMVRHRPVINLIEWVNSTFGVGPSDRLLFVTSMSFDLSVYDIFGMLAAGGTIRLASSDELRDPDRLFEILATEPITFWDSAPARLQQLAPQLERHRKGGALRLVFLSGDWIPVTLPDVVRGAFPAARVISLGGATEATIWSNVYPIERVDPAWPSIPYGKPIQNARYHVLDRHLAPCPIGVPGDLYIGGDVLADGYARDPALTAGKFVPDPFAANAGARLYRTGDRARYHADGNLEFLGRLDEQVKIRGYRIELGEIEHALRGVPGLRECVVIARGDRRGDKQLVAYLVGAGARASAAELRARVAGRLPEYMVPAAFVWLDQMPQTANGKVDRKALPEPSWSVQSNRPYSAPATDAERSLAALWCELLEVEQAGRDDRFFELGGHSIVAARVVSRLYTDLHVDLPIRLFLSSPTLADAAAVLANAIATRGEIVEVQRVPKRPDAERAPMTFAQEAVWLHEQLLEDPAYKSRAYLECPALHIRGRVNAGFLERALNEIAARYEIWRTSFVLEKRPVQLIQRSVRIVMSRHQLPDVPAERRREEVERFARSLGNPFDLAKAPLVRCALVSFGQDEHYLLVLMHHLITDGWSETLVFREILRFYELLAARKALPPRDAVVTQFADYAAWERGGATDATRQEDQAFWQRVFADPPELFGWSQRQLASDSKQPRRLVHRIAPTTAARLAELCRAENVSQSAALYAVYAMLLGTHTNRTRFVIAVTNANRSALTEHVPGLFATLVPVIVDLSDRPTLPVLTRQLSESLAAALPHASLPLSEISRMVSGKGKPKILFEAAVATQFAPLVATVADCEITQTLIHVADVVATLGLIIDERRDGSLDVCMLADPRCFDEAEHQQLVQRFEAVLNAALVGAL